MRRIFLASVFLVCCAAQAMAGWTLVLNEEFDASKLDHTRWFTRYIYSNETLDHLKNEKQVYRDDGLVFEDGKLKLTARSMNDGAYRSGMIRSKQTFYYGYFEARTKFPSGRGVWPAFWLNSDYDEFGKLNWPPEIDIFEFVLNGVEDKVNMVHSAVDKVSPDNKITYAHPKFNVRIHDYISDTDLTTDWHTWGLLWLPDSVSVYMDGVKLYTTTYSWLYKDGRKGSPAHVLLNLAIGGPWAGRHGIDESAFPQSFDIDYVRVYQYVEGSKNAARLPVSPNLSEISYVAESDMKRPKVYPAAIGHAARGRAADVSFRIDDLPQEADLKLFFGIFNQSDSLVSKQVFDLPGDSKEPRVALALPAMIPAGQHDLRLAIGRCPEGVCEIRAYKNIPLSPQKGVIREKNGWYTVGRFEITHE